MFPSTERLSKSPVSSSVDDKNGDLGDYDNKIKIESSNAKTLQTITPPVGEPEEKLSQKFGNILTTTISIWIHWIIHNTSLTRGFW